MLAAIDADRFEVHLESYIFEPDDTGQQVLAALVRAAKRGVTAAARRLWLPTFPQEEARRTPHGL